MNLSEIKCRTYNIDENTLRVDQSIFVINVSDNVVTFGSQRKLFDSDELFVLVPGNINDLNGWRVFENKAFELAQQFRLSSYIYVLKHILLLQTSSSGRDRSLKLFVLHLLLLHRYVKTHKKKRLVIFFLKKNMRTLSFFFDYVLFFCFGNVCSRGHTNDHRLAGLLLDSIDIDPLPLIYVIAKAQYHASCMFHSRYFTHKRPANLSFYCAVACTLDPNGNSGFCDDLMLYKTVRI